jgi:putative thioredoxin
MDAVEVAATLPPADILERRVRIDGNDLRARLELAELHIVREEYAPALDQLLEIAGRDRAFEDDIGRRKMVEVFAIAADQGELVADYRAKLSAILF